MCKTDCAREMARGRERRTYTHRRRGVNDWRADFSSERTLRLAPLEHRLALLQESPPRLLAVLAAEGLADVGDLEAQLALQVGPFRRADHAAFQEAKGDRRPGAELLAIGRQAFGEARVVHRLAGHAPGDGFLARDRAVL